MQFSDANTGQSTFQIEHTRTSVLRSACTPNLTDCTLFFILLWMLCVTYHSVDASIRIMTCHIFDTKSKPACAMNTRAFYAMVSSWGTFACLVVANILKAELHVHMSARTCFFRTFAGASCHNSSRILWRPSMETLLIHATAAAQASYPRRKWHQISPGTVLGKSISQRIALQAGPAPGKRTPNRRNRCRSCSNIS